MAGKQEIYEILEITDKLKSFTAIQEKKHPRLKAKAWLEIKYSEGEIKRCIVSVFVQKKIIGKIVTGSDFEFIEPKSETVTRKKLRRLYIRAYRNMKGRAAIC